jgi:23S rRNA pseudouridine2457 synthase
MPRYVLFHKPYGVLSQFTPEDGARSLAEFDLPSGIYPAGRLDKDSEGLLLLTDDGPLIEQLLNPRNAKPKTYWALVERVPDEAALQRLRSGLRIEDYQTRPCEAKILAPQPEVPPRTPPVRVRKTVQDVWPERSKVVDCGSSTAMAAMRATKNSCNASTAATTRPSQRDTGFTASCP